MLDRTPSRTGERWPSTQRPRTALRPLLRFWVVLLAAGAGGAGILQALGPPPKAVTGLGAEPSPAPAALTVSVDRALGAVPALEPVPTPDPVQAPVAADAPLGPSLPTRAAERSPSHAAAGRVSTLLRRRTASGRLQLALGRLRREQFSAPPTPDEAEESDAGMEAGYAAAEPWHAPVQYPWLYGWPTGAQAYSDIYPGRR